MIKKETIDQIFEAALIEEVVGDFVQLKKAGSNYKGLSPFTNEKTASFVVSPAKGIYKCFSSGRGGNAVSFLMELEKFSYPEALKYLANKYAIEIEESIPSPEELEKQSEREALSAVVKYAAKYFQNQLWNSTEGKSIALSYLKERGFSNTTLETFQIGYNPGGWDTFTTQALQDQYSMDILQKAGLSKEGKQGKAFDFFNGRIVFPILSSTGSEIAFGGRTMESNPKGAKYFNSPESDLYHKSKVLYGLYQAKKSVVSLDECFLVEGYTDVLALFQSGVENVVASAGTSLTGDQIRLIKRFTPNITVLYDGDAAGIKASFRGIDLLLKEGINVRCVLFPDGEDPDSFAKSRSDAELKEFINTAKKDFIHFKTEILLEEIGDDPIKKSGLIKELVASISLIPDSISRQIFIKQCSRELQVSEDALLNELNKDIVKNRNQTHPGSKSEVTSLPAYPHLPVSQEEKAAFDLHFQEKELLRVLLTYGNEETEFIFENEAGEKSESAVVIGEFILSTLENEGLNFSDPLFRETLEILKEGFVQNNSFDPKTVINHPDQKIQSTVVDVLSNPHELCDWNRHSIYPETEETKMEQVVKIPLFSFYLKSVELEILQLQNELKTLKDDEQINENLKRQIELKSTSNLLAVNLNNRVILR
jgi:DNA primase